MYLIKFSNLAEKPKSIITTISIDEEFYQQPFIWPTLADETTMYFGPVDEVDQTIHNGIDIQGEPLTKVWSATDDTVAFNGTHKYYGNAVYINFKHDNIHMQIRYGHLNSLPDFKVGDTISKGTLIGAFRDSDMNNPEALGFNLPGRGIIEISLLESAYGNECKTDESNTKYINPLSHLKAPLPSPEYLSLPMAVTIDPQEYNKVHNTTVARNADLRYWANLDINGYTFSIEDIVVYLMAKNSDQELTPDDLIAQGVLTYTKETLTVNINDKVFVYDNPN